jgi:hypothetical protein
MKCTAGLALVAMLGGSAVAQAQGLPSYMEPISGVTTTTPGDVATRDVLALNTGMFELYGDAGKIFQANMLARHPVHAVSPGPAAARGAAGAGRLSVAQIGRPFHHGVVRSGRAVSG